MNQRVMRLASRIMIAAMLGLGLPMESAHAGLVSTDRVTASSQAQSERERVRAFLDREDVRNELQQQGLDADGAKARVDAMTDEEVKRVAGRLDQMPAGGDIIGVLFAVFVILLVTDILGFTKVFSFTRPIK
jgi:hypothetical protein